MTKPDRSLRPVRFGGRLLEDIHQADAAVMDLPKIATLLQDLDSHFRLSLSFYMEFSNSRLL